MGRPGALLNTALAVVITLLLVLSGPGMSLVTPSGSDRIDPPKQTLPARPDPHGSDAHPVTMGDPPGEPAPSMLRADFAAWNAWSHHAPVEQLVQTARAEAPMVGQKLIPSPDALPGYAHAPEPIQREAWRSWWLATELAAMRSPSTPLDHTAYDPYGLLANDGHDPQSEDPDRESPLGEPRGLERLWRLQAHGAPRIVLPADDGEQMYLVTDRGVLFIPKAGAQPDWMLNIEGIAGHAEIIERSGDGLNDLVIGMHSGHLDMTSASIWVIDGASQEVRFHGLRGDRSLLHWTLTDVDGDGEKDILGIDQSGNITAIRLDGSEIYRKPLPYPDLPEVTTPSQSLPDPLPNLDAFAVLALVRTGAEMFGDATGDGTKDIFATAFWGLTGLPTTSWVSLIEGVSGEEVWSLPLEPVPDALLRVTIATATGDLNGDGHADVGVYDAWFGFIPITLPKNIYLSGENGLILARDPVPPLGSSEIPLGNYIPVAFADFNGDGEKQIVAMAAWVSTMGMVYYFPTLQIRELPPVPGGPTLIVESHEMDVPRFMTPSSVVQIMVREVDGKDVFIYTTPHDPWMEDENGIVSIYDDDGFRSLAPSQPIGHFDIHPTTGQAFTWTLNDDRFTPVDRDLKPVGNGTRLIMSAHPILSHALDGGVPDLLIPRSLGYFWVSGRTGAIMSEVDRPQGTFASQVVDSDDRALLLERNTDGFSLFDVTQEKILWNATGNAVNNAGTPRAVADFTGDGELEIFFHRFGGHTFECNETGQCAIVEVDDYFAVYSPAEGRMLWQREGRQLSVIPGDVMQDGKAHQVVVTDHDAGRISMHAIGEESPVWSRSVQLDWIQRTTLEAGHLFVTGDEDHQRVLLVLEGPTGSVALRHLAPEDEDQVWTRVAENPDGGLLYVASYARHDPQDPDSIKQQVIVTDVTKGEERTRFDVSDPVIIEETFEFFGSSFTFRFTQYTMPGVNLGDWNGDGVADMALREEGWPSVRSLKDGEILAVGPLPGSFTQAIDLNQDGRSEVGLGTFGSLRMYAYDPTGKQLVREDPMQRVDAVNPDEGDQNATAFFDREEERSPGPALVLVVGSIAVVALALRRMNAPWHPRYKPIVESL